MLSVNRIGHQVRFGTTSEQLRQKFPEGQASATTSAAQSTLDDAVVKKASHTVMKTVGVVLALVGAGYLAKTGKLGETAQKYFDTAAKTVTEKATFAWEATTKKLGEWKDSVVNHFKSKEASV